MYFLLTVVDWSMVFLNYFNILTSILYNFYFKNMNMILQYV